MNHFLHIPTDSSQQLLPGQGLSNSAESGTTTPSARDRTGGPTNRAKDVPGLLTQVSLRVAITSSAVILCVMLFNLYLEYQSCLLLLTHDLKRAALNDTINSPIDQSSPRQGWLHDRPEDGTLKPLDYKILPPAANNSNNWTCILIHGLGDYHASDSFRLREALLGLRPALFEPMSFIIPSADPLPVTVFGGQLRSAWFDIRNWTDVHRDEDIVRMKTNVRRLIHIIHHHHLDMNRTIIAGFSQGAVMSLLLGLTLDPPPAGLVMLSGFLPIPSHLKELFGRPAAATAARKTILHWLHGGRDPYFPLPFAQDGFKQLKDLALFPSQNLFFSQPIGIVRIHTVIGGLSTFVKGTSFAMRMFCILSWCCTLALAPRPIFDLNFPPESCLQDSVPTGLPTHQFLGNKRKSPPVPISSINPSANSIKSNVRPEEELDPRRFETQKSGITTVVRNGIQDRVMIGIDHKQYLGDGPQFIQPTNSPDRGTLENNLNTPGFLSNGLILEELLSKFSTRFRHKIYAKEYQSSKNPSSDKHPAFPFTRVFSSYGAGRKVTKVLHHRTLQRQPTRCLLPLYNHLVISLYKQNCKLLNLLNIPTSKHRKRQESLLEWLEKEIFEPAAGVPLLGRALRPDLPWESGAPELIVGETQVELIKYFSEGFPDPNRCALNLLELHRARHGNEYPGASSRSSLRNSSQLLMSANLQESFEYLSKLAEVSSLNRMFKHKISVLPKEDAKLFSPYIAQFETRCHMLEFVRSGHHRSYHPNLPISMCIPKENSSFERPLRIVHPRDGTLLGLDDLAPRLRILLKSVDRLHLQVLSRQEIHEASEWMSRRNLLNHYILEQILQPKSSLPLLGHVRAPEDIAPWYSESYGKPNSFGEIQWAILKYFTANLHEENLTHIPPFILATWLHDNYPSWFISGSL
ncbi:hypothetical protein PSTG_06648 [Puccinia striiformis f. sp. tritici PST-78]|uniref:Acyl-protein thioesterase 1 n=1 Tax=Puccinia striiformis f. sp. tritici PST-78 TaxID=1165861 RepID=A0A0L0VM10_9BASI|nr:hypothetical protein PSTG_06648 [Puccinia striiformis f. sp. tritici PST-78]